MSDSRVYIIVSAVIFSTFIALTGFSAYRDSREALVFIKEREIPALGLATASQLDVAAFRYKRAGEELLRDGFIRDWILSGEKDVSALRGFMDGIRDRHGLLDASIVSDRTETYYGTDGRVLTLSPDNWERDGWYYLYREAMVNSNIDFWYYPETGIIGMYVNVPIFDRDGSFLGVTGGGINAEEFSRILKSFEQTRGINIYLARRDGRLVYSTDRSLLEGEVKDLNDLWEKPVTEKLRRDQRNTVGLIMEPAGTQGPVLWGKYLEDWDTFLVVERKTEAIASSMRKTVLRSLIAGGVFAASLFILTLAAFHIAYKRVQQIQKKEEAVSMRQRAVILGQDRLIRRISAWFSDISKGLLHVRRDEALEKEASALTKDIDDCSLALGTLYSTGIPKNEPVQLSEVIHETLLKMNPAAAPRGVALYMQNAASPVSLCGDRTLIRLALEELLDRAVSSSPSGTEILISTHALLGYASIDITIPPCAAGQKERLFSSALCLFEAIGARLHYIETGKEISVCRVEFAPPQQVKPQGSRYSQHSSLS